MTRFDLAAFLIAIVLLVMLLMAGSVQAQGACYPSAALMKQLADKYGESQHYTGTMGNAAMFLYVDEADGSWTMLASPRPEVACIVGGGDGFEENRAPPVKPGRGT